MSQNSASSQSTALSIAWQRYAELDFNAAKAQKRHLTLRRWVIILSVVATVLAILSELVRGIAGQWSFMAEPLRILLILTPIAGSVVLAFANKFQQGERWLALRAGAEEIKKEIYLYRTILQGRDDRDHWLTDRVATIQRQTLEAAGGDLVLTPLTGAANPAGGQSGDSGYTDLLPDDYLRYRLNDQLGWHQGRLARLQQQKTRLQILIFFFGGLGTLLAGLGGLFQVWVALTAALAAALTAWLELQQHDTVINNYSQVIVELQIIDDHWHSLKPEERTGDEFFKLVIAAERVLWSQHSKFVTEMRKAVAALRGESQDTLDEAAKIPAPAAMDEAIMAQVKPAAQEAGKETAVVPPAPLEPAPGAPHAFVVMPFGRKQDRDGRWLDFNSIYQQLIKPALIQAGFQPFRADEETISGDILTDMFQELLLADLVLADLSIDNANAFYELGVRHAMRKRGVVHIQSGRAYMPFDVFNVRTIPYHTGENGKPDPQTLDKDIQTIAKVAQDTWASDRERVHSPIFNLLDGLTEPDRQALRTPLATGYWREYKEWQERVDIARRQNQIGDVLLLTEEVRNPLIQAEAIGQAAKILSGLGHHALALQQYRRGLEIRPENTDFQREEAFELGRLKRRDEAVVKLERLIKENPADAETIAFLGRLYKDTWVETWRNIEEKQTRLQEAYEAAFLLKRAIDAYQAGYGQDQNHFYTGINALTLSMLLDHLAQVAGSKDDLAPEIEAVRQQLPALTGAVQFSLAQATRQGETDFWAFASQGDMAVNTAKAPQEVTRAYRKALALGSKTMYSIQSVLAQLRLLDSLAFRPEYVQAGIAVLEEALQEMAQGQVIEYSQSGDDAVQVFLCAGHMIDRPDRPQPRFPAAMEAEARDKIENALNKLKANGNDMLIAPGIACGGDILFIEACLQREMKVEVYLPFPEAEFIENSVRFAGDPWVERFYKIRQNPRITIHLQPERLGPVPTGESPYARNTRWALYSTLCYGIERVRLVVLWDGKSGGDGPGGTSHMVREVRQLGGIVEHLDTTKFNYWQKKSA